MVLTRLRVSVPLSQFLIPFCFLVGCSDTQPGHSALSLVWQDSIASALIIPRQLIPGDGKDSISQLLQTHLANDNSTLPVIGEYTQSRGHYRFTPLVPFTRGLTYEVIFRDSIIGVLRIPYRDRSAAPRVMEIYPTSDTVPENLLKIFIRFSRPMAEADPLSFVRLVDQHGDTLSNVFLDLHPALWNQDGTLLTLWLDPGRIKRELQPNQRSGPPLVSGKRYELVVLPSWQSKEGVRLTGMYSKRFCAAERDTRSPVLSRWNISGPVAGSRDSLLIQFDEPLDYSLLHEAVRILDEGTIVEGRTVLGSAERSLFFIPADPWENKTYRITAEARLEDLAGNNLDRLFDQDVTSQKQSVSKEEHSRSFHVKQP